MSSRKTCYEVDKKTSLVYCLFVFGQTNNSGHKLKSEVYGY